MTPRKVHNFFRHLQSHNPDPETELNYNSPFELLIAVLLSAQATDVSVNQATEKLFAHANTPEAMAELGLAGIKSHIRTIGLFNNKAKNVLATCEQLIREHDSQVPNQRDALEALPGVGRKTANVVLNTAFGQPTMAVDTHIFRVSNRTGLAPGKNVLEVERRLLEVIPKKYVLNAHHWLILHGRYVCKARQPRCSDCIVSKQCEYSDKNLS